MALFYKGMKQPWRVKKYVTKQCVICEKNFDVQYCYREKITCSQECKNKYISNIHKNRTVTDATKEKQRIAKLGNGGKNHWNYRGYKNRDERDIAMSQDKYIQWRKRVFEKDGYTCQSCFFHGGYLEAHHIKNWKAFPEFRYTLSNGITLCRKCHKKEHKNKA